MKTDKWFKENGFTHIKQTNIFGHYFRIDPLNDKIGQKIKWFYDDSSDMHFVKWQMWRGNEGKRAKIWYIPKGENGIKWECETDNESIWDKTDSGYAKLIEYIKNHSDEKFKLLKDFIEKKHGKS